MSKRENKQFYLYFLFFVYISFILCLFFHFHQFFPFYFFSSPSASHSFSLCSIFSSVFLPFPSVIERGSRFFLTLFSLPHIPFIFSFFSLFLSPFLPFIIFIHFYLIFLACTHASSPSIITPYVISFVCFIGTSLISLVSSLAPGIIFTFPYLGVHVQR